MTHSVNHKAGSWANASSESSQSAELCITLCCCLETFQFVPFVVAVQTGQGREVDLFLLLEPLESPVIEDDWFQGCCYK